MATRSRIAIEHQDGTVTSIYCHFDGYLSHNGEILQNHFQDREKVEQLIALGDISSLTPNLNPTGKHTFDNPEPEITVAYHRDRGEHLNQNHHKDVEEFFVDNMQEYGYLFTKDNKWLVSKFGPVSNLSVALEGHDVL
jgi:hypothetical protein